METFEHLYIIETTITTLDQDVQHALQCIKEYMSLGPCISMDKAKYLHSKYDIKPLDDKIVVMDGDVIVSYLTKDEYTALETYALQKPIEASIESRTREAARQSIEKYIENILYIITDGHYGMYCGESIKDYESSFMMNITDLYKAMAYYSHL